MNYLLPDKLRQYEEKYDTTVFGGGIFKQKDKDNALVQLMRINLLKRMESSIESFRLSVERLLYNIDNVLDKIESGIDYNPNINIDVIDPDENEYENLLFGKKRKILLQDMDLVKWKQDLELDKEKLTHLLKESKNITSYRDGKLKDLKDKITLKIHNPINPGNKKVIVFTAFASLSKTCVI